MSALIRFVSMPPFISFYLHQCEHVNIDQCEVISKKDYKKKAGHEGFSS